MKKITITREKFTTTISPGHKKRLSILAIMNDCDRNEWIEKQIDKEWNKIKGDDTDVDL